MRKKGTIAGSVSAVKSEKIENVPAAFLREVLQYLQEEGVGTEQICLTKEGEASVEDEYGKRYWLKDMISGSECRRNRIRAGPQGCGGSGTLRNERSQWGNTHYHPQGSGKRSCHQFPDQDRSSDAD